MGHKRYKCFICGKEYDQKSIKPIRFKYNQDWVECTKFVYKGKRVYLCNEHFRMCAMVKLIDQHCDIDFKEE